MAQKLCCPQCGNKDLQVTTETQTKTTGSNYSGGKGCLGFLLFGPLGLLCGSCGQGQTTTTTNHTYWICPKCGKKFTHPDELRQKISSMQSPIFTVMCIIGAILAFLFFVIFSDIDAGVAFTLGVIAFGIFALGGYLAKITNDSQRSKLEDELRELESKMNRFKDE